MSNIQTVEQYLDAVCSRVKCKEVHSDIRLELATHLEDIVAEELQRGATPDDAAKTALSCMGDPLTVGASLDKVHKPRIEWSIVALLISFLGIALITMYSVKGFVPVWLAGHLVRDTFFAALVGGSLAAGMYLVDYRQVLRLSHWLFGLMMLVLVMASLDLASNSSLWFLNLRMMVAASPYILAVTAGVLLRKHKGSSPIDLAITCAVVGVPAMLLLSVPSFSSAAVYLVASFAMLVSLRVDKKRFAAISLAVVLVLLVLLTSIHPYAWSRMFSFLNPQSDPHGAGWLPLSLTEAIQQGGAFGQRTSAALIFPEPQTDFVFTFIIYRYGWVTGLIIAMLAALLIMRLVQVCRTVREPVGRTIAIGVTTTFALYFMGNMLMATAKGPLLSLSFPFISYGRVLLVVEIVAIGLVLGIYRIKDIIIFIPEAITNEQQA